MNFFTEENVAKHREYLKDLNLKYSILKKSASVLDGKDINEIYSLRTDKDLKRDALRLLYLIRMHELYFSSFSDIAYLSSDTVRKQYKNEADLLNGIYKKALATDHGFVLVYLCKGKIEIVEGTLENLIKGYGKPMLALDVCEHSYFLDYGFCKDKYLIASIPYLKIDIFDI